MKLAALYTVWNGLELLEGSIEQIQDHVDEIIICWQEVSNKGERSEQIIQFLERFNGTNIKLIEFTHNPKINTKQNEILKHNLMIQAARSLECSHFFLSATDHFYDPEEFCNAKMITAHQGYDVTFTKMFTYYKKPTWQLQPIEDYHMPFICRIHPSTHIARIPGYPVKIDPSIQITPHDHHLVFAQEQIMMHHFSMIREDIENKFRNAAASIRWKPIQIQQYISEYKAADIGDEIAYFGGRKLILVDNRFKI
ncbi:MAG: hypothetical protein KAU20_05240 [Nanoarchaeota archaeon]|nr:hypothetical protein [Nanoarchaeota archaeon]